MPTPWRWSGPCSLRRSAWCCWLGRAIPAWPSTGCCSCWRASLRQSFVLSARSATARTAVTRRPTSYMDGPIKVATIAAVIWGIAGFVVGDVHRLAARLSRAEPRPAVDQLRAAAAAAHLGRDLRLRRQRAARHLVLRRAAHLPRAPRRPLGALVRGVGLPALHRRCRHRLPARHHAEQGVRRARVVRRPVADHRLGRLPAGVPRHAGAGARSRTSTWRTGSISPSSSPSPCCTSSTTRRSPSA